MHKREVHTLVGRSGTGKTTLLRQILRETDRALVLDVLGNFRPGLYCRSREEILSYFKRNSDLRRFRVIYYPAIDLSRREAVFEEADFICRLSRAVAPCDVFIDELDTFCDATELPPEMDVLIRYGRNIGVSLRAAVRRPRSVIPRHYITETTRFSIFRCVDPNDSSFLESYTGISKEAIARLEVLQYLDWREGDIRRFRLTRIEGGRVESKLCGELTLDGGQHDAEPSVGGESPPSLSGTQQGK